MKNMNFFIALILLASIIGGCVSNPLDKNIKLKLISIIGEIGVETADAIIEKLNTPSNATILTINSQGGNEMAALKIAKEINKHQISVIIDGACISACAHLILPAAKKIFLTEGSIIGFHTNIFGWLVILQNHNPELFEANLINAAQQYKFLEDQGVDVDMLYCASAFHNPNLDNTFWKDSKLMQPAKYSFIIPRLRTY